MKTSHKTQATSGGIANLGPEVKHLGEREFNFALFSEGLVWESSPNLQDFMPGSPGRLACWAGWWGEHK